MYQPVNMVIPADEACPNDLIVHEEKLWMVENVNYSLPGATNINLVDAIGNRSRIRWWDDYKPAVTRVLILPR